eukprot:5011997-Alexandrium_andersonii.AAC.1
MSALNSIPAASGDAAAAAADHTLGDESFASLHAVVTDTASGKMVLGQTTYTKLAQLVASNAQ